jgi:dTDP-4-dehydrorhamnose reductase
VTQADILLTGGDGQIGTEFRRLAPPEWRVFAPDLYELDIGDPAAVDAAVASNHWAAVINTAAYTAVDAAETEIAMAWRVNALGPAHLAQATVRADVPLVQISTDYVFDGRKPEPYVEDDPIGPLCVYGASKEAGEQAVRTGNPRHLILRTAWLISPHGGNFAKTMLRLAADRSVLRVVDDQIGCPTSAGDVAAALVTMTVRMIAEPDAPTGTYHCVNSGQASWCDLARAIFAKVRLRGGPAPEVEAIGTKDYPTPAHRPANSRLSTAKLERDFGIKPRPWRTAADEVVDVLLNQTTGAIS